MDCLRAYCSKLMLLELQVALTAWLHLKNKNKALAIVRLATVPVPL